MITYNAFLFKIVLAGFCCKLNSRNPSTLLYLCVHFICDAFFVIGLVTSLKRAEMSFVCVKLIIFNANFPP